MYANWQINCLLLYATLLPQPDVYGYLICSSNSLPTPSQPVVARQHDNVHHATTTVLPPRFNPHAFLPDSIDLVNLENLPPYPSGMSELSSPSPSLISEASRFTPNHIEYPYPSYPFYQEQRYRNPSIPSVNVSINDTSGSIG